MITKKNMKRVIIEMIILFVMSFIVIGICSYFASGKQNERLQVEYSNDYSDIIDASYYEELDSDLVEAYKNINHVYIAYDDKGNEIGFVVDITIDSGNSTNLHLIQGITYDGARLTGMKLIDDSTSVITEEDISVLNEQLQGNQIPVSLTAVQNVVSDDSTGASYLSGLNDGTYYAQNLFANNRGYIDFVEMDVTGGVITRVQWNAFNIDPTTPDRRSASLSGAYQESGELWATQSYNLCHALMNLQNPDLLAMKSDGTTEIIDGVTVNIRDFVNLVWECIDNSRAGFTKDDYYDAYDLILTDLFEMGSTELGLVNSDGYIVYSFSDYPNFLNLYDENEEYVRTLNVREYYLNSLGENIDSDVEYSDEAIPTNNDPNYDGSDDGIIIGDIPTDNTTGGIPASEIRTYIEGIPGDRENSGYVVDSLNITYRFLKDYLNWMA